MKADSEGNAGPQSYNRTEADGAGNYIYIYIHVSFAIPLTLFLRLKICQDRLGTDIGKVEIETRFCRREPPGPCCGSAPRYRDVAGVRLWRRYVPSERHHIHRTSITSLDRCRTNVLFQATHSAKTGSEQPLQ